MGRAFPPHPGCPVPSVSAITGELVSSCKIDPPADPIFSFPIFAMPIPNPPSFNFGCYRPSAKANVAFNQPLPYFSATVKFPRSSDTGNCEPKFRFDVGFPAANCPDISASGSIHLLPPGHSPSLSLTVHKRSDRCEFKFRLSIGIPGGECTSVSAGSEDGPIPPDLNDGDFFKVLTGVDIEEDDSGACTLYKLLFNRVKFTLDILDDAFDVDSGPGGNPNCCESFQVVSNIDGWTYPPHFIGPGVIPTLNFTTKTIQMPQVTFLEPASPGDPTVVNCGDPFNVVVDFDTVPPDLCPCGLDVTPILKAYKIKPPTITAEADDDGAAIDLSEGAAAIVTSVTIDDSMSGSPCNPIVRYHTSLVSLGGITAEFDVVCDVTCTSTSLVVKKRTLDFLNGVLVDAGTCAT